jgi:hypothetical protein
MRWIDSTQGQKWIKKGVWKCPDIEAIGPNNTTYTLPTSIFATTDPIRAGDVASSSTIDTGCLQGNYCSEQLGMRLMEEGQPPPL